MPIYSFGVDSPLKFELTEEEALRYNRFTQAFFDAQTRYREEHGVQWTPTDTLTIDCAEGDMELWNDIGARVINPAIKNFGRDIHEDELTDDFLVKN